MEWQDCFICETILINVAGRGYENKLIDAVAQFIFSFIFLDIINLLRNKVRQGKV
jgi:hypothetical protein